MAITVKEAQTLYVSYFGRPADFVGLQYWTGTETLVGSLEQLAHSFYNSAEGKKYFPVDPATNQIDVTASINAIYANMFARVPDTAGFDYWYNEIASGKINLAEAAVAIYRGAQGKDALMIENKIAAATQFTDQVAASDKPSLYYGDQAFAKANEFLNTVTDTTDVTSAGFAAQVNAAVNVAEAAGGASSSEGGIFKLSIDDTPYSPGGTLTNEANVGFTPEGKYLTAGNDVIDLSEWTGAQNVTIGDAFSNDNDKVSVLAAPLSTAPDKLKLTAVENLEIISSVPSFVRLNGANFKGLEAIKLIGETTTLDVSNNFTYGIKVDATANADSITGSNKADTINGGDGNDTINAGSGNDVLIGGNGADTFVVGSVQSLGIDKILDFSADDKISVEGFAPKALKNFDASTFSTVNYKSLDAALATFAAGGKYQTKAGDVVIFSYDGATYALLSKAAGFNEGTDSLVDITGANVASLTESNFGTIGNFENYAAFKAAVDAGKVDSPTTIKSITADNVAALLTTDKSYLASIDDNGIGAVTGAPVNVTMTDTTLNTSEFASKLGAGVPAININITGTAYDDTITSSFAGSINGGDGDDTITVSGSGDVTVDGEAGNDKIIFDKGYAGTGTVIGLQGTGTDSLEVNAGTVNANISAAYKATEQSLKVVSGANLNLNFADATSGINIDISAATIDAGATININGGTGGDTITGSNQSDIITGGAGDDSITGGSGADTFVFADTKANNGTDTIADFTFADDKLDVSAFLGATATVQKITTASGTAATGNVFVLNSSAAGASDNLTGLTSGNKYVVVVTASASDPAKVYYYTAAGTSAKLSDVATSGDQIASLTGVLDANVNSFVDGNFIGTTA